MPKINNLQELFDLIFSGDAADRTKLLERFTPSLLEWYFEKGYIQ